MIYVTIIDDDHDYRKRLAALIDSSEGCACVGEYGDCETALKFLENEPPDVVLMDIGLPGMSGIDGAREVKKIMDDVDIIMLTVHETEAKVFESLRAGACGYLLKNVEPDDLLRAIKEANEGGAPMNMYIARMVTAFFQKNPPEKELTERQREILRLMYAGKNYQIIAGELHISKNTVKFHIKNIYKILQVTDKAGAVRKAIEENLI